MPHWAIIPNLAADVIVPPLLHLMPVHVAGRCFLGAVLLLNLAGVIALHGALFRRLSLSGLWPPVSQLIDATGASARRSRRSAICLTMARDPREPAAPVSYISCVPFADCYQWVGPERRSSQGSYSTTRCTTHDVAAIIVAPCPSRRI